MKVLLINSPIRLDAKPNNIPYGLATIANTLLNRGFEVEILDINALRPTREALVDDLRRKHWDIVGVSGLITTYAFQKWLIAELKRLRPDAPRQRRADTADDAAVDEHHRRPQRTGPTLEALAVPHR